MTAIDTLIDPVLPTDDLSEYERQKALYEETLAETSVTATDWRTELYLQGIESEDLGYAYNDYYTELMNEWPKLYALKGGADYGREGDSPGFKDSVVYNSLDMDYFLDFIDTSSALGEYSVSNIGRRTKVLVDNSINCIFEPRVNDIVFIVNDGLDLEGRTY
jgi:hypothetical protein